MLSEAEHDRLDAALGAVIERSTEFTAFQVEFACRNADRLAQWGRNTRFSARQWRIVEEIERRIEALEREGG